MALRPSLFPLASIQLQYFPWWAAFLAFAVGAGLIVLLGLRSLAGLGKGRKWVAIGVRLAVLLLFILILGGIRWTRQLKDVEVILLQDVSLSMDNVLEWPGRNAKTEKDYRTLGQSLDDYFRSLAKDTTKQSADRIGLISFRDFAKVDAMPNKELRLDARGTSNSPGTGTDIASAIQLGLATMSPEALHRFVLVSDGNANLGDTEAAIGAAVAAGVPIDIVPMKYDVQNDVMVDRFIAPGWRRENEPFSLTVVLRNTNAQPVTGKLRVIHQTQEGNQDLDMDISTPEVEKERAITLSPGLHKEDVRVAALKNAGVHRFKAIFTPDKTDTTGVTANVAGQPGAKGTRGVNAVEDNDVGEAFTFVQGKGEVLYVDNTAAPGLESPGAALTKAMAEEGITLRTISIDQFPNNLVELQNYDAILLSNVPKGGVIEKGIASGLSSEQDTMLRTYVHDMGGGLVVIGGDQSFGAGGWQGSEMEKILPVDMEIPAQRQVGKGALVMVMHSCEMPQGNYWGEQCALKAAAALSSRDDIGVISYGWNNAGQGIGGAQWDFPLSQKGDGSRVNAAIKKMQLGDMPSFDDALNLALNGVGATPGLKQNNATFKHVIIVSDGDPASPQANLMGQFKAAKVSVTTVTVYPHVPGAARPPVMDDIPAALGGKAYGPIESDPKQLPQIFIKEATLVRRTLIHEEAGGIPVKLRDGTDEMVQRIGVWQPVFGMVLTSRKNDPKVEMPLSVGPMNDPLLAHWQTGLGKAAVWTSDAHNKWAARWLGSPAYNKLFAQIIRGVSRPPMSNDFDIKFNLDGGKGEIVVEALDKDADALNFLNITGTVVGGQDLKKEQAIRLVQVGPGQYKATFDANGPGAYVGAFAWRGKGKSGIIRGGGVQNSSPEKRDLKSNEAALERIRQATGGRRLEPFEPAGAEIFSRESIKAASLPLPVWDWLVPWLLALIIIDVAVRRIAWDWKSTRRLAFATAERIRSFTVLRKVESKPTLDALKRVREGVAEIKFRGPETTVATPSPSPAARPDPAAKFTAPASRAVEGDISQVVGGATDKPIPAAPKKIEPKGGPAEPGGHMGGLMAAKKRAQQQIKDKEEGAK